MGIWALVFGRSMPMGLLYGNPIRETSKMLSSVGKNKLCKLSTSGVTQQTNKLPGEITCGRKSPECCMYEERLKAYKAMYVLFSMLRKNSDRDKNVTKRRQKTYKYMESYRNKKT
jgi:hypothetical protein